MRRYNGNLNGNGGSRPREDKVTVARTCMLNGQQINATLQALSCLPKDGARGAGGRAVIPSDRTCRTAR